MSKRDRNTNTMKKIITLCALALTTITVSAQNKGFVSGNIQFMSEKTDPDGANNDVKTSSFTFGPAVGFNVNASNVVGLALNFSGSKVTTPFQVTGTNGSTSVVDRVDKENLMEIAPFYRYVKSVGDKFSLYGQFKVGFGFGKNTSEVDISGSTTAETKISTVRAGIGPGIVFVPATHWALSADWGLIGYHSRTEKVELTGTDAKTTTSGFEATFDPGAITLALNWLF